MSLLYLSETRPHYTAHSERLSLKLVATDRKTRGFFMRERRLAGESAAHGFASRACEPGRCRMRIACA